MNLHLMESVVDGYGWLEPSARPDPGAGRCCVCFEHRRANPRCPPLWLDEDALPRAVLGSLGDRLLELRGHQGHPCGTPWLGLHLSTFFDIGESVVEPREDCRSDLFTEP